VLKMLDWFLDKEGAERFFRNYVPGLISYPLFAAGFLLALCAGLILVFSATIATVFIFIFTSPKFAKSWFERIWGK